MKQDKVAPFPGKHKKWNRLRFFIFSGMMGAVLLILMLALSTMQHRALTQQLRQQQEKAMLLSLKNQELAEEVERLKDPGYIEVLARRVLGLVKPGERIFILDD